MQRGLGWRRLLKFRSFSPLSLHLYRFHAESRRFRRTSAGQNHSVLTGSGRIGAVTSSCR